jgi:uncharacterized membrane protein
MLYLSLARGRAPVALFETWLVGLTTMVVVGTLVRNGRIAPPLTDAPGWARLFPTLILLRVVHFNAVLLVAIHGGVVVAAGTGAVALGLPWSFVVSAAGTLLFPRVVDEWMARRG